MTGRRSTVVLVPGLFSPRWHLWGLRRRLRRAGFDAIAWDDASVFGSLDQSISRLCACLQRQGPNLGVVTHSFGDWLFRQAAARGGAGNVTRLVSLVPVMGTCTLARLLAPLGRIAPELGVMANGKHAAAELRLSPEIQRLIVWARVDPWVPRVAVDAPGATKSVVVRGTHNSLLWQPGVHRMVRAHLEADGR